MKITSFELFKVAPRWLFLKTVTDDGLCGWGEPVIEGRADTVEDVRGVKAAGGSFVISPNTDLDVIRETKAQGMLSIPGFFTASEGFAALKAGADYLKLFPAILGPGYVKDLKAVIKAPIMAVGGVNADNLPAFMQVCCGAGIGSALYKAGKSLEAVAADAERMVAAVRK